MNKVKPLEQVRNVWIIAHIDAGKTTTTERILYYTWKKHKIGEVHEGEAEMDWMEQEQDRGITITSAATTCFRKDSQVNIIDTPWHVDFTVEVERSLRVLDGAVTVFSSSDWVQPQTETVRRQADKYKVPRLCFVNKIDKLWADFAMCVESIKNRLSKKAVAIQFPNWEGEDFKGEVDIILMKYYTFGGKNWEIQEEHEIPSDLYDKALEMREEVIDAAWSYDDEIAEKFLAWENIDLNQLKNAIRRAVCDNEIYPVMVGSALKNAGVQLMLDAVTNFLPAPTEVQAIKWIDPNDEDKELKRESDTNGPASALVFKIMTDPYVWTLSFARIYSGTIKSWDQLLDPITWKKERIWRLLVMHARKSEEVESIGAWQICAFLWLKEAQTWNSLNQ